MSIATELADLKAGNKTVITDKATRHSVKRLDVAARLDATATFASKQYFAQQRELGIFDLADPEIAGGVILNAETTAAKTRNNAVMAEAMTLAAAFSGPAATPNGGVIMLPVGHIFYSQAWNITARNTQIIGRGTGMRSHVYSDGVLGGSQLRYASQGNAIQIVPTGNNYLSGVLCYNFGISTDKFGQAGRDSDTCAIYLGASDNTTLDYLSITQIGRAIEAIGCDTPKLLRLWICEAGAGIRLTEVGGTGFHAHVTGCTIADLSGRDGTGPNGGYGISIQGNYEQAMVYSNTFARNNGDIILKDGTHDSLISGNTFKESNGVPITVQDTAHQNVITKNLIRSPKVQGIVLTGGDENEVSGNSLGNTNGQANIVVGTGVTKARIIDNNANIGVVDNGTGSTIRLLGDGVMLTGPTGNKLNAGQTVPYSDDTIIKYDITNPGWKADAPNNQAYNDNDAAEKPLRFTMGTATGFLYQAIKATDYAVTVQVLVDNVSFDTFTLQDATVVPAGTVFDSRTVGAIAADAVVTVKVATGGGKLAITSLSGV